MLEVVHAGTCRNERKPYSVLSEREAEKTRRFFVEKKYVHFVAFMDKIIAREQNGPVVGVQIKFKDERFIDKKLTGHYQERVQARPGWITLIGSYTPPYTTVLQWLADLAKDSAEGIELPPKYLENWDDILRQVIPKLLPPEDA